MGYEVQTPTPTHKKHQHMDQCIFVRTLETSYEAAAITQTLKNKKPLKTAGNFMNFFSPFHDPLSSVQQCGQEEANQSIPGFSLRTRRSRTRLQPFACLGTVFYLPSSEQRWEWWPTVDTRLRAAESSDGLTAQESCSGATDSWAPMSKGWRIRKNS